jgi:hypothetical protein
MKSPPQRAIRFVERLASSLTHTGKGGDPQLPDAGEAVKEVADRLEAKVAGGDLRGVFRAIDEALEDPATLSWRPLKGGRPRLRRASGAEPDPHYWG